MRSSRRLEFTDAAAADLRSLLAYAEQAWGVEQKRRYADLMSRAMHELLAHPELGSTRDELAPGLRGHRIGQHVIFYLVLLESIRVIRILHAKMNPATHLLEPPGDERPLTQHTRPGRVFHPTIADIILKEERNHEHHPVT